MRAGTGNLKHVAALAILLVSSSLLSLNAAPPKVPSPTVKVSVGEIKSVEVQVEPGKEIGWAPGFAPEHVYLDEGKPHTKDTARFIISPKVKGTYRLILWTVGEREFSTLVIDSDGSPVPTPKVDPKPEPIPPPKPKPDPVPVVTTGLRVVFWYESRNSLSLEHNRVIYGEKIEAYLNAKCAKYEDQPEWRRWDQDVKLDDAESPTLNKLHAKIKESVPSTKLPVMVVFNDAAGEFYPLTTKDANGVEKTLTEDQALALLKLYGGE